MVNTFNCLNCGKQLNKQQRKYCSNYCQQEYQHKEWVSRWKNGEESGLRGGYQNSFHLRKYLMDKYNCKCCICGWGERNTFTNSIPLEIDHIDGNYKNNNERNLRLICPNCHSLTMNYKGAGKIGRKERKKYYTPVCDRISVQL